MIWRSLAMLSCMEAFIFFAPGVATFLVLITHAAIHADRPEERLQIEEAYAVLGFVNVLVKTFNTFPRAIKGFDEARISFRRIERFLILPEANAAGGDSGTSSARSQLVGSAAEPADPANIQAPAGLDGAADSAELMVSIRGACAAWGGPGVDRPAAAIAQVHALPPADDAATTTAATTLAAPVPTPADTGVSADGVAAAFGLHGMELSVRRGELVLLLGEVGSGKSSSCRWCWGRWA